MFRNSVLSMLIFALFAAFPLIIGIGGTCVPLYLAWVSRSYQPVPATVVLSETRQQQAGRTGQFPFTYIEYEYEVGGVKYIASTCTISDPESLGRRNLAYWQQRCPVGAKMTALVDPADPTQTIVDRRLTNDVGMFCVGVIALLPLTLYAFWGLVGAALWRLQRLPAGVPVRELVNGAVLRIPADAPILTGFAFALIPGLLSFLGWMVLSSRNGHPFLVLRQLAMPGGLIALAVFIGWLWKYWRACSGRYDVVIDDAAQSVSVPRGPENSEAATFSFDSIASIHVRTSKGRISSDVGNLPMYSYIPTIAYRTSSNTLTYAQLVRWSDKGKAQALVRWLSQRLSTGDTGGDVAGK